MYSFLFAAIPVVAKRKQKGKLKIPKKVEMFAFNYKASHLPNTALSQKLETHVNYILEHNNTGASVTIRSFSREVYKEYL